MTAKAESVGYHPHVILAGRRINNGMGKFIAEQTMKLLGQLPRPVKEIKVAVLGLTFKENVPDLRNSRVPDIIQELREYGVHVLVHDSIAEPKEAVAEYGIQLQSWDDLKQVDGLIIAVPHRAYTQMSLQELLAPLRSQQEGVVVDVKCLLDQTSVPPSLKYWRL